MRPLSKANQERISKGLGIIPLEETEQENFVKYMEILQKSGKICKFTAIPNSTRTPYVSVRAKQIRQWVRAGLPDLFIIYKKNKQKKAVFIEMKRKQGGTVSQEQKEWIHLLNETEGLQAFVAKGFDEAKKILDNLIFK